MQDSTPLVNDSCQRQASTTLASYERRRHNTKRHGATRHDLQKEKGLEKRNQRDRWHDVKRVVTFVCTCTRRLAAARLFWKRASLTLQNKFTVQLIVVVEPFWRLQKKRQASTTLEREEIRRSDTAPRDMTLEKKEKTREDEPT